MLWCFARCFVRSSPGRQRFNVLAALNAISYELVMVTNDTYINAGSIGELLRKIVALNLNVPITVILDNAKYQKCQIVWALAKSLHIELLYLPTYSPNLNLIERLWKFVKKQCLYSIYYPTFLDFKNAISTCLSQTTTIHKTALSSLLTLNFQTFTNVDIIQR
jgi:transposase